jgi:hypothetical protein
MCWTAAISCCIQFFIKRAPRQAHRSPIAMLKKAVRPYDADGFFEHGFTAHLGIDLNHFQPWSDI